MQKINIKYITMLVLTLFIGMFNPLKLQIEISSASIIVSIMLAWLVFRINKDYDKIIKYSTTPAEYLIIMLFSVCHTVGYGLIKGLGFDIFYANLVTILFTLVCLIYYYIIGMLLLKWIYYRLDNRQIKLESKNRLVNIIYNNVKKNNIKFYLCIMLIGWGIVFLIHLPGLMMQDTVTQLLQYYQIPNVCTNEAILITEKQLITTHHSILHTLLMGSILDFGKLVTGSLDFGVFLYSGLQLSITALIVSKMFFELRDILGEKWTTILLLIFTVHPIFAIYSILMTKDTYFCCMFILFMLKYIKIIKDNTLVKDAKFMVELILIIIVASLFRNNAIYSFIFTLLILLAILKDKKYILLNIGYITMIWIIITMVVFPKGGFSSGSRKEMLSIPFQQTAYYITNYEDEVTEYEKETINKVLQYDKIKEKYQTDKSDDVKALYNKYATNKELRDYFKVWFQMFTKHPWSYIEAFIHQTYGYFFISTKESMNYNYINSDIARQGLINNGLEFNPVKSENIIELAFMCINLLIQNLPLVFIITDTGAYIWLWVIGVLWMLYKKVSKKDIILYYMPLVSYLLIILAGPVNGTIYFRYMAPFLFTLPFSLIPILHVEEEDTDRWE